MSWGPVHLQIVARKAIVHAKPRKITWQANMSKAICCVLGTRENIGSKQFTHYGYPNLRIV